MRLAHALKLAGASGEVLDGWLIAIENDPVPEVRFALTEKAVM